MPTNKKVTFEEYIASEQESEIRHEFDDGILIPLEATSKRQNRIIINVLRKIDPADLATKGCEIYHEKVITRVEEKKKYAYPDVVFTCDPTDHSDEYLTRNPCIIMEVFSRPTASYKFSEFFRYRRIPSLQQYILVSQYTVAVEYYLKMEDGQWIYNALDSLENKLVIPSLSIEINVSDLYAAVVFDEIDK